MALSTFAELKASIADWLNREDLTSVIPDFISMAEAKFNRTIRDRRMIKRATSTVDSGYVDQPTDWLETISLITTASPPVVLEYMSSKAMNELRATERTGTPIAYTQYNDQFYLFPVPTANLTVELTYYEKIDALSDSNTSNWLLTGHPDIYLFGSLLQAEPYLKNDERLMTWGAMLTQAMEELRMESERAKRPDGGLHVRKRTFS